MRYNVLSLLLYLFHFVHVSICKDVRHCFLTGEALTGAGSLQ